MNNTDRLVSYLEIEEKEILAVFQKLDTDDKPNIEDYRKMEDGLISAGLLPRIYPFSGWCHLNAGDTLQAIRYGYSLLFLEQTNIYSNEAAKQVVSESKIEAYKLLYSAFIDAESKTHAMALINQAQDDGFDLKELGIDVSIAEAASDHGTDNIMKELRGSNVVDSFQRLVSLEHNVVETEANIIVREKGMNKADAIELAIKNLQEKYGAEVSNG